MGYTITDYFETNRHLADCVQAIQRLKATHAPKYKIREAEQQLATVSDNLDELIEVFTWETADTDNIRTAFILNAREIEEQLHLIQLCGLYPDPYNGSDHKFRLAEDIIDSFRLALSTTGSTIAHVSIKSTKEIWQHDGLLAYVRDMQRQLNNTTFDNLLEALHYFEKSSAMLGILFKWLDNEGLIS